jgi:hypothetical protein
MTTKLIHVLKWQVEVDLPATKAAQQSRQAGGPESCGCLACRNFIAARNVVYPAAFVQLLEILGIPENRESEIYHCGEVQPGLHFYGGWFHLIGRNASGPDVRTGGPLGGSLDLETVSPDFSIGFTEKIALLPPTFPKTGIVQLDFSARVPWVLDELHPD